MIKFYPQTPYVCFFYLFHHGFLSHTPIFHEFQTFYRVIACCYGVIPFVLHLSMDFHVQRIIYKFMQLI